MGRKRVQDMVVMPVVAQKETPTLQKVMDMLSTEGISRKRVCEVLSEGLSAVKQVVCDGEIFEYPDYPTREKYVELVLDVMGERKGGEDKSETHYHFTNVLQQVRMYEANKKVTPILDQKLKPILDQKLKPILNQGEA